MRSRGVVPDLLRFGRGVAFFACFELFQLSGAEYGLHHWAPLFDVQDCDVHPGLPVQFAARDVERVPGFGGQAVLVDGVHGRRCWGSAANQSGVQKGQEESFGFKSFVFMMVKHVSLQCFQKFRFLFFD